MAIIFISPQKRKKVLIQVVTGLCGFFLVLFTAIIFFRTPETTEKKPVFEIKKIEVNFAVLELEELENLDLFETRVKKEFEYEAETEEEEIEIGRILAFSVEKAEEILENFGLRVIEIEEVEIGRKNPFIPKTMEKIMEETNNTNE